MPDVKGTTESKEEIKRERLGKSVKLSDQDYNTFAINTRASLVRDTGAIIDASFAGGQTSGTKRGSGSDTSSQGAGDPMDIDKVTKSMGSLDVSGDYSEGKADSKSKRKK